MSCTNCYNGCAEIVSDQCVRYTGVDIPLLGIQNGDTLLTVENAIISFVTPFLNGSGIKPTIDLDIICDVVRQYIPTCVECNGFNLNDVLSAIIKAVCDLQIQINNIVADIAVIEADYEVDCIEGVTANAGTHDVLQAVITTLCEVQSDLAALSLDLSTNYVRIDQINDYIAAYLASTQPTDLIRNRMVPFSALEFYGDLIGKFDATGKGFGTWVDIYLCNGNNGTPDKRGRVAVCAIADMGGGDLDIEVDPNESVFNPNYVIDDNSHGVNFTTLNIGQIPDHTHFATVTINDPGHIHNINVGYTGSSSIKMVNGEIDNNALVGTKPTLSANTGLKGTGVGQNVFVLNSNIGGNQAHSNLQPVYPCYYIIYIPS
jgi:microcystin-dependent protein